LKKVRHDEINIFPSYFDWTISGKEKDIYLTKPGGGGDRIRGSVSHEPGSRH